MTSGIGRGHIIIVMAPSGSGKKELESAARRAYPHMRSLVSCTTRQPRPGEVDGKDYHFLSRSDFEARIAADDFVEWAEFSGNLYGTLKSELTAALDAGEVVLADAEVQGVEQLRRIVPKECMTVVYIDAGGWEALKGRVLRRAPISEEELALRHERYVIESASQSLADVVIENFDGKLEEAQAQFVDLVGKIVHNTHTS